MLHQAQTILITFVPIAIDYYKQNARFYCYLALMMSGFYLIAMSAASNLWFLLGSQLFFAGLELGTIKVTFDIINLKAHIPTRASMPPDGAPEKDYKKMWKELFSYYYLLPLWISGSLFKTFLIVLCFLPWGLTLDLANTGLENLETDLIENSLNKGGGAYLFFIAGVCLSAIITSKLYFFEFFLINTNHAMNSILYSIQISDRRTAVIIFLFVIYYTVFIASTLLSALVLGPIALLVGITIKQISIIVTCLWYNSLSIKK